MLLIRHRGFGDVVSLGRRVWVKFALQLNPLVCLVGDGCLNIGVRWSRDVALHVDVTLLRIQLSYSVKKWFQWRCLIDMKHLQNICMPWETIPLVASLHVFAQIFYSSLEQRVKMELRYSLKEQPKPGRTHSAGSSWLVKLKLSWGQIWECYTWAVRRGEGDPRMVTNLLSCRWQRNLNVIEKKRNCSATNTEKIEPLSTSNDFRDTNALAQRQSVNHLGAFMGV